MLTEAVRGMVRTGDMAALTAVCGELRRRGKATLPWQLSSRELFLYAAAHSDAPEPMLAILSMAPRAIFAESKGRGYTALHETAFCRRPRNVEALLRAGFDARATNLVGETALHVACFVVTPANVETARALLAHDPGLASIPDDEQRLPLDRLWEALARCSRAEKRAMEAERCQATIDFLALLDPCGSSAAAREGRSELLRELGVDPAALHRAAPAPTAAPGRRRPRRPRR